MLELRAVLILWIYLKFIFRLNKMATLVLLNKQQVLSGRSFRSSSRLKKDFYFRNQGVLALYSGISASLLRQLTYSTTRFAIYEMAKQSVSPNGEKIGFGQSLMMAAVAGGCGGVVGTPGDMVNVRMQNDVKLPPEQRRK